MEGVNVDDVCKVKVGKRVLQGEILSAGKVAYTVLYNVYTCTVCRVCFVYFHVYIGTKKEMIQSEKKYLGELEDPSTSQPQCENDFQSTRRKRKAPASKCVCSSKDMRTAYTQLYIIAFLKHSTNIILLLP